MKGLSYMYVDVKSIVKNIKKKWFSILLCMITTGTLSYMAMNSFLEKQYAIPLTFSITSKSSYLMSDRYHVRTALERMERYLNSTTMQTAVSTYMNEEELSGSWEVEGLVNSNLIQVTCIASTPEEVFTLAQALRTCAPLTLEKMSESYQLKPLGKTSIKNMYMYSKNVLFVSVILSLIVGFLGLFLAIISQIFSGMVQNSKHAKEELDLLYLAQVPHENHRKKQSMLISSNLRSFDYVEAFQKCALSFVRQMNKIQGNVCVVTSMMENEGKSTVAANLALALVKNKKRVFLIDTDFRKPALYKIFEQKDQPDFVDFMEGNKPAQEVVVNMPQEGLYCCFCQKKPEDVDTLLGKKDLAIFIEKIKSQVDYVIIDSSPAFITDDAKVVGAQADALLMVVRTNTACIPDINEKVAEFQNDGIQTIGMIVNDTYEWTQVSGKYKGDNVYASKI